MRNEDMQECIDKMAIMDVLGRYSITVDTGDAEGFANLFTEDAIWHWENFDITYKGRQELREFTDTIARLFPGAQHATSNHVIDVDGDKAHAICQLTGFFSRPEKIYPFLQGYYEDDLVKVDGKWLIARRHGRVLNPEILQNGEIGEYYKPLVDAVMGSTP